MAQPYGKQQFDIVDTLIEAHGVSGVCDMIQTVLTTRWNERNRAVPGTTDCEIGAMYVYRTRPVENLVEVLHTERNRLLGLPKPPSFTALLDSFRELLEDQNDCAQYLEEGGTQEVSRQIYNDAMRVLKAAKGEPCADADLWGVECYRGENFSSEFEEGERVRLTQDRLKLDGSVYFTAGREGEVIEVDGQLVSVHFDGSDVYIDFCCPCGEECALELVELAEGEEGD